MEEKFKNPVRDQEVSWGLKKSEALRVVKVTNAVYKILDFLPDGDPLKNKAKEKALVILENATLASNSPDWFSLPRLQGDRESLIESVQKEKALINLAQDIEILENYLKIGKGQGWMGVINFLIITKEYDDIKDSIGLSLKTISKDMETTNRILQKNVAMVGVAQELELKSNQPTPVENDPEKQNPPSGKLSARQEKILQMLQEKKRAQVSDFIKELPNITKRTIRRDLDDLLKRGKIMRVGEWNQVFYTRLAPK